jgi:PTH1 family peptidyl-tRNA hydrolase
LRDIENSLGSATFKRLRIGIGHPGKSSDVTNYVLSKFSSKEREILEKSMEASLIPLNLFLEGSWEEALLNLHTIEK